MSLYKIFKYLAYLIGAVGVVLYFVLLGTDEDQLSGVLGGFTFLTWFTVILTIAAVLVFMIIRLATSDNIKTTLASFGAFIVVFIIAYLVAGSEGFTMNNGTEVSGTVAKWVDTGLFMFYILAVVAIVVLAYSSVKKLTFRN